MPQIYFYINQNIYNWLFKQDFNNVNLYYLIFNDKNNVKMYINLIKFRIGLEFFWIIKIKKYFLIDYFYLKFFM